VALGVPVPPLPGNPLDPPLRSRFQGLRVTPVPDATLLRIVAETCPRLPQERAEQLVAFYRALLSLGEQALAAAGAEMVANGGRSGNALDSLMYCSERAVISAARLWETFPRLSLPDALDRIYPSEARYTIREYVLAGKLDELLSSIATGGPSSAENTYSIASSSASAGAGSVVLGFDHDEPVGEVSVSAIGGAVPLLPELGDPASTMQDHHVQLLTNMLQSHALGQDICLIGERGAYVIPQPVRTR
jgi:hypothetical protein